MQKSSANEPLTFTVEDIRENCDEKTFVRGMKYFENNAVLSCELTWLSPKTLQIVSTVSGSGDNIYKQYILVNRLRNDDIEIVGDCDCPVGFNCKHVVAATRYAISVRHDPTDLAWKKAINWLERFHTPASENETTDANAPQEVLLYKLFEKTAWGNEPLTLYKSRILKKGGYGKPYRVDTDSLLDHPRRYRYVQKEDITPLTLLRALRKPFYPYSVVFEGETGALALSKIIATNRAFFKDPVHPVQKSENTIRLAFHWEEVSPNQMRIVSNLHPEGVFIPTEPFFYLDPVTNRLHELLSEYDAKTITLLLDAPEIEKNQIERFMKSALSTLKAIDLPIPETFQCETIDTPPVPKILVRQTPDNPDAHSELLVSFLYGTYEIPALPQKRSALAGESEAFVKIDRRLSEEEKYLESLRHYGFSAPVAATENRFEIADTDIQKRLEKWRVFLEEGVESLQKSGWIVEFAEDFQLRFEHADTVTIEATEERGSDWFDIHPEVVLEKQRIPLLPLVSTLLEQYDSPDAIPEKLNLQLDETTYLHLSSKSVKPILQTLFALYTPRTDSHLRLGRYDAHLLEGITRAPIRWNGPKELLELGQKLRNFKGIEPCPPAKGVRATLRDYQQRGLDWLAFLHNYHFNGILADDMGLGKTLQTLALLQKLKESGKLTRPVLIVMPTSLIGNWKQEIAKFTPDLKVLALYGNRRAEDYPRAKSYDILLTTYQLVLRDLDKLAKIEYDYIILDEAQKIKNPKAKMTLAVKSLRARHKLALTGTPMENHLGELWSMFDFLMPGFLYTYDIFVKQFKNPIEKESDQTRGKQLREKIAPFMLRRTKDDVLHELPEKIEIIQKVTFGPKQALLYENIRLAMEKRVADAIRAKGVSSARFTILNAILKLRQVCCDPKLLKLDQAKQTDESAKRDTLFELLEELLAEGRKVLLFSQFTTMLSILEAELRKRNIDFTKLTGQTTRREEAIARFGKNGCNLFLMSLKAGGVGLNLTEADTVIHYDPWWNPAVEDQATDRAHRIGQTKTVFVYKLVVENSIEEKILDLQTQKRALYDTIYDKKQALQELYDADTLLSLLQH